MTEQPIDLGRRRLLREGYESAELSVKAQDGMVLVRISDGVEGGEDWLVPFTPEVAIKVGRMISRLGTHLKLKAKGSVP
jgi:hypothetical protein